MSPESDKLIFSVRSCSLSADIKTATMSLIISPHFWMDGKHLSSSSYHPIRLATRELVIAHAVVERLELLFPRHIFTKCVTSKTSKIFKWCTLMAGRP